jgi:2-polyprenyl-6-methoxyphenol hydroxylase-like FAD-dependent oxidoreductase
MSEQKFGSAIVIGGSMAGLLAARVLADHFETVTVVERDAHGPKPDFRRGVPQGRHAHALLLRGLNTICRLFPDIRQSMIDAGATIMNQGREMRWFHFGVWKHRYHSRLEAICSSRPLLEWMVCERVRHLSNVVTMHGWSFDGLAYRDGVVRGVGIRARDGGELRELSGDLVIDATGRGSQIPAQLKLLGLEVPEETRIQVDLGYASRIYRAPATPRDWKALFVIAQPPSKRAALILPIEGDRWLVTEAGMHGDHPPADERGFLEYARSLPEPDIYDALKHAEPLTPITRFGYPAGQRRHYERLREFPEGLLVIGDAVCSFNPIYGQGMSAASMYADALDRCLRERIAANRGLRGLWRPFFREVGKVADMPWQLSTSEDFRYSETIGPRSLSMRLLHWYTEQVQIAASGDAVLSERLFEIMHLLKEPASLMTPAVWWRLLSAKFRSEPSNSVPGTPFEGSRVHVRPHAHTE